MQGRRCNPSWGTTKGIEQKIVREFCHVDLSVLCFMVEDRNEKPADVRRIMTWSCHGVSWLSVIAKVATRSFCYTRNELALGGGGIPLGILHLPKFVLDGLELFLCGSDLVHQVLGLENMSQKTPDNPSREND